MLKKRGPGGNQGRKPKPTAMRKTHYVLFTMRSFRLKISRGLLVYGGSIGQWANTIVGWAAFIYLPDEGETGCFHAACIVDINCYPVDIKGYSCAY